jgi:hypothetical protein
VYVFHFLEITVMLSNNVDLPAHGQSAIKHSLSATVINCTCLQLSIDSKDRQLRVTVSLQHPTHGAR